MFDWSTTWPWIALMLLGAFHGLNPAMGWLFAVAIGFQDRSTRSLITALGPISAGHALAIALVAVPAGWLGLLLPRAPLLIAVGLVLLGFVGYKVATRFRHPRWVGLRLRRSELALWSFVMATAHGAGLMLVPVLAGMRRAVAPGASAAPDAGLDLSHAGHQVSSDHHHLITASSSGMWTALTSVALHSGAMLAVAALVALVVYRKLGVAVLRRGWVNLDMIWFSAFAVAGLVTFGAGIWLSLP